MGNKAVDAAATALASVLAPKNAAFARAPNGTAPPSSPSGSPSGESTGNAATDDLAKLIGGIDQRLAELEARHLATGKKIDAWNTLPAGSASSITDARELIEIIDADVDAVRGLLNKLERAKKVSKRVPGTSHHVDTIHAAVDGWRRDLEADREALLVAARAVGPNDADSPGKGNGADLPLPMQVERALADGYQRRDAREDEAAAAKMLPSADDRKGVAAKLEKSIAEDIARQTQLEGLIAEHLASAREAAVAPPQELRAAADQLKAWGMGLAFEKSRLDALRK